MNDIYSLIDKLSKKRKIGDAHADEFIDFVLNKQELDDLNVFFRHFVYDNQIYNEKQIPKDFLDYIEESSKLPEWADIQKIELAERTFTRIGPAFILAYFCKSLPECYACGNGAEVLYKTGRLTTHTRRRVAQTAQFVLDVMSPGGLEENGSGIVTTVKVRLMHASIRYYFLKEVEKGNIDYDIEERGYPINQEDLMGTMLAFSYVVIEGIEKLGFRISTEEKEAVLHLWKCIGHLLGIEDVNLIKDYDDAGKVWNAILSSQSKKTEEGKALNDLLVDFLDEIIPEKALDDVVLILMYHLMGKEMCNTLGLKNPKIYNPIAIISYILGIFLLRFESRGLISRFTSHYVNMRLMKGLEAYIAEGKDTGIYIPPSLRDDWHMDNISKSVMKAGGK